MKKLVALIASFAIILSSASVFAAAENIIINGEFKTIPIEMGKIVEIDNRTFVPVRFITEAFGCTVKYSDADQLAYIFDNSKTIFIQAGSSTIAVMPDMLGSANIISMDTQAFINNDESRMYVPIRFLAEAMDYVVDWDETTQTVIINSAQ